MTGHLVSYQAGDVFAMITMDDGKVNALSPLMIAEIGAALDKAVAEQRVPVLTGRPGVFSAGFDLSVLGAGGQQASTMARSGFDLATAMLSCPLPVVAACTGHAVAMGAFLLLSADLRIGADEHFKITANEVAIGLTMPQTAIEICRQRISPAFLTRVITLAEVFTPATAVTAGFLDQVVPAADLPAAARQAAAGLAQLNLAAYAQTKTRMRAPLLRALADAAASDEQHSDLARDHRERTAAAAG
jgi:enoyl-CoA hydratase/carnithine racemase